MGKYCRKHIGKKFITNEGYEVEVIDGGDKNGYCKVRFVGLKEYILEVSAQRLKDCNIKNPYHPSVYGIGYLGIGKYNTDIPQYERWRHILQRSYDKKCHKLHPTYKNITVISDWHNYQIYAKWEEENYVEGWQLDKDLLSGESKIYSPETCCFIPRELNSFMTNNKSHNTSGHTGVTWIEKHKNWIVHASIDCKNKYIGSFYSIEEASECYKKIRAIESEKWKIKAKKLGLEERIIANIK